MKTPIRKYCFGLMAALSTFAAPAHAQPAASNDVTVQQAGLSAVTDPRLADKGAIKVYLRKQADTYTMDLHGDGLMAFAISKDEAESLAREQKDKLSEHRLAVLVPATQAALLMNRASSGITQVAKMEIRQDATTTVAPVAASHIEAK